MGAISEHFTRSEFACKCGCGFDTVDVETLAGLEDLRAHFGAPVYLDDGCRCAKHNAAVGGAVASLHMLGRAADIRVEGIDPDEVVSYLEGKYPDSCGIGRYKNFTHYDSRKQKARWDFTSKGE